MKEKEEKESEDFEVIDKRKSQQETTEEKEPQEKKEDQESKEAPPTAEAIDVYSVVRWMINLLYSHAWQYMGLIVNPQTKAITKDLNQARLAIDCISSLVDRIESNMEEQEKKEYRALLSDLQLNFVQQSQQKS